MGRAACAAVIAATLTACGAIDSLKRVPDTVVGWFDGDARHPALARFIAEGQVRTVWSNDFGASGNYVFAPLLREGSVCGASVKGRVSCLDLATGKVL
jgi:hypothetical protein